MDGLMKYTILVPCKVGIKTLTAAETVKLFFTYVVIYFGVP